MFPPDSPRTTAARFATALLIALFLPLATPAQAVYTGQQTSIASGLSSPSGVAVDSKGNLFVADTANNRILEFAKTTNGYAAPVNPFFINLSKPTGIAIDSANNLYIADTGANLIVEELAQTNYASIAFVGSGWSQPSAVAVDSSGSVYVADTGNQRLVQVPFANGAFQPQIVLDGTLLQPVGVAVDTNFNVFVADQGYESVLEIPFNGVTYLTPMGVAANLVTPTAVAVDRFNNLYYTNLGGSQLFALPIASNNSFATPTPLGANLKTAAGITIDPTGKLFTTDSSTGRLFSILPGAINFGTVNLGAMSNSVPFNFLLQAGQALGSVAVLTQGSPALDFVNAGNSTCIAQSYASTTNCQVNVLFRPTQPGLRTGAVVLYSSSGQPLATATLSGTGASSQIAFPSAGLTRLGPTDAAASSMVTDGTGNLFALNSAYGEIWEYPRAANGFGTPVVVATSPYGLSTPGLAIDGAGNLIVSQPGQNLLFMVPRTSTGFAAPTVLLSNVAVPQGIALDAAGNIYVAEGAVINKYPRTLSGYGPFIEVVTGYSINNVAVDPQGNVFYTDNPDRVYEIQPSGASYGSTITLAQGLNHPTGLTLDINGNLFVAETQAGSILEFPYSAGSYGTPLNLPATGLVFPKNLAFDARGNLFVADQVYFEPLEFTFATAPTTHFATTQVGFISADSPATIPIANVGNLPLNIANVTYPANFLESLAGAAPCQPTAVVLPTQQCTLTAYFFPGTAGALTGSLTLTDDLHNRPGMVQNLPLSGTGKFGQTITFTAIANRVYGAANTILLTATASSGLAITYKLLSGHATLSAATLSVTGIGPIVVEALQAGSASYEPAYPIIQTFTVTPALLTVKPTNALAIYGAIPSSFGYTISGFVLGQTASVVSGSPAIKAASTSKSPVGTYAINASRGTLAAASYTFAFTPGTLTVTPANLTFTANNLSIKQGSAIPTLTYTIAGYVNGDTSATAFTGTPALSTTATSASTIGTYPIKITTGTLASTNYTPTFVSGTLTITQ